jgi:hypothetical protein
MISAFQKDINICDGMMVCRHLTIWDGVCMATRKRDGKNLVEKVEKNELNLTFDRDAEQLVIGYTREVISKLKYPELAMQIGKDLAPMMGAAAYLLSLKHPHETITEKDVKRVEHHLGNAYLFAHRLNKAYARKLLRYMVLRRH